MSELADDPTQPQVYPSGGGPGYYQLGHTSVFAARADQRIAWCAYVPRDYATSSRRYPLAVVVHGTERRAESYRDRFAEFGERHGCVVLAPLFPAGIEEPGEVNNYKWLEYRGIRFDRLLLALVDEIAELYRIDADRFLMHGFSGGGHFVHRFLYLHPERLLGASIGAPGVVTLLDTELDWWVGVRDVAARFGRAVDLERVREVPVQTVIGSDDDETWEITLRPGDGLWMPGSERAGRTRLDRIAALGDSLARHGVSVRRDVVPGVGHDGFAILEPVRAFFADVLRDAARERAALRGTPGG